MNEKIINQRWDLTRSKLKQFQASYKKLNKRTQDKLQNVFKGYNITRDNLYKSISSIDKTRLEEKIEELKENDLFNGYFEYKVTTLMKGNLTYKDLLTILIYATYIEEKNSLDSDIDNLYSTVALDCLNKGRQDLKKEEFSILPYAILSSFSLVLIDGINWDDYLDALVLTNAQEIEKQGLIHLQQDDEVNIYSDVFQRTFDKQRNRLICINEDKYSGALDKYTIALGNYAYLEASEENQKVKFVSDHCENVTKMCEYMDGMIFNTREQNKFKRPVGSNKDSLIIEDIDIKGLVIGINQPPINQHFHWCHSCLVYQIDKTADELRNEIYTKEQGTCENQNYVIGSDGNKYVVDDKQVILDHSKDEIDIARWYAKYKRINVKMLPRVLNPRNVKTGDFVEVNTGIVWEIKEPDGNTPSTTMTNQFKGQKDKAHKFIVDIHKSSMSSETAIKEVEIILNNKRYDWVEEVILKNCDDVIKEFRK